MPARFILTGAPGAGKTVLIHALAARGFAVAPEAATDVIGEWQARGTAEPWATPAFIEAIADLQRERQRALDEEAYGVQFYDRSLFCTIALEECLGHPLPPRLRDEAEAVVESGLYQRNVFFVESLGFITPTEARRISLEDARRFGELHRQVYSRFGFQMVPVAAASIEERVARVLAAITQFPAPPETRPLP